MAPASKSSCGRALGNAEIRRLVCVHLSRGDLYRASTVNKSWEGTASPLIWAELPSLMPLMRLIPTSYVVEAYNTAGQNPLSRAPIAALLRPERAAKRRSRRLAALVKCLRVTENDLRDRSGIPLVFWIGHTVFPSLVRLVVDKCKDFGNDHVALLRQLLPLNLHAIDIGGVNRYSWDLASSFPSLRDLSIDGNIELERIYPWRFTTLTRVKLAIKYSTELMEALARFCPALRAVRLDLRDDSIVHELSLGGGESFPALQRLSISGVSSAFLTQSILKVLPCRHPMEEIRVHHASISHFVPAADDYLSMLNKINQLCDPSALRTLVVFARKPTDISPYPTGPTSYLHLIAPLSGLLKLSLISWHGLKFSDADCVKFPSYWPQIRFLWLCNLDLGSNQLTLAALLPFAEMCANLVTLGLVLDARATPPLIPPSLSPSSTLIYLGMFTSPIAREGVDGVARFIAALFPKLRSVCASSASPYKPIWDEVSAKLSRGPSVPSEEGCSYAGDTRTPQLRNRCRGEYREGGDKDKPHANVEATGMSSNTPVARQGITESPVRAGDDRTSNSVRAPSIKADADIASRPPTSGPSSPGSTRQRLAELEQRNSVLEKQNSALEKARAKLERRYNTMEDRLDMEINDLQRRNSELVRDLTEANKQKEVLARELKETEAHYESQEKRLLALEHSIKAETEMARAIEAVRQERDELSWRLTSVCRERDEYADRYEALKHHADELQASYENAERRVLELTADRASVHQALADLALRTSGMPGTAQ